MQYPKIKDIKYPKAGYPNPVIDVYVYTPGSAPWKVTYPEPNVKRGLWDLDEREGDETDGWGDKKLITSVRWMGTDMLMVSETNRVSDHYRGVLVDVNAQTAQVVRDEKIETGWFEIV
jgi:dipeptidyl aminopeptidase B